MFIFYKEPLPTWCLFFRVTWWKLWVKGSGIKRFSTLIQEESKGSSFELTDFRLVSMEETKWCRALKFQRSPLSSSSHHHQRSKPSLTTNTAGSCKNFFSISFHFLWNVTRLWHGMSSGNHQTGKIVSSPSQQQPHMLLTRRKKLEKMF